YVYMPASPSIALFLSLHGPPQLLHSFPTRRSSDLLDAVGGGQRIQLQTLRIAGGPFAGDRESGLVGHWGLPWGWGRSTEIDHGRSEEHTSELQSRENLVCRLLLEKKKNAEGERAVS